LCTTIFEWKTQWKRPRHSSVGWVIRRTKVFEWSKEHVSRWTEKNIIWASNKVIIKRILWSSTVTDSTTMLTTLIRKEISNFQRISIKITALKLDRKWRQEQHYNKTLKYFANVNRCLISSKKKKK